MATATHEASSRLRRNLLRYVRKFVPSVAAISRSKMLAVPLNVADYVLSYPYREFRDLPPNHLRIRVGTGPRPLFNQVRYITNAYAAWLKLFANQLVKLDSCILDIGCGCGRSAHILRDAYFDGAPIFKGTYIGVDVDEEAIEWCKSHFPGDRFKFYKVDMFNSVYNPKGNVGQPDLQVDSGTVDFVLCGSLFTHLLEENVAYYLKQIHRVLRYGGTAEVTFFCIDHLRTSLGGTYTFRYRVNQAYVESLRYPEAAVAYEENFLLRAIKEAGLTSIQMYAADPLRKRGMIQSHFTVRKQGI